MQITIIVGSHRPKSQSGKVGEFLKEAIRKNHKEFKNTEIISLAGNPLPLWSEEAWDPKSALSKMWKPYGEKLAKSDGFIFISPEWNGMAAPGLKNLFLYMNPSEVAHKPVLLVTVSSGLGGSSPAFELRASGYKDKFFVYLPTHLAIRNVESVLNSPNPAADNESDKKWHNRIKYELNILAEYAKALSQVRKSGVADFEKYPFGM